MPRPSARLSFALLLLMAVTRASASSALPANVQWVDSLGGIQQYKLKSNGMTILLKPNAAAPVITFEVVYHVGSRNEAPGNTGSAEGSSNGLDHTSEAERK